MLLNERINQFLKENKLAIIATATLASAVGVVSANYDSRFRLPSDISSNAKIVDERKVGDTKYMVIEHYDKDSARNYWTGHPNCIVLVEYTDDGINRHIKSTHYFFPDNQAEGFQLSPVVSEFINR